MIASKHSTVMTRVGFGDGVAVFSNEAENDCGSMRNEVLRISNETWTSLGQPDTITISVEPGDLLNPPDPIQAGVLS